MVRGSLIKESLEKHGHAALSFAVPRWEKHYDEHARSFWSALVVPLLTASSYTEFVLPEVSPGNVGRLSALKELQSCLGAGFIDAWMSAIRTSGSWDCYLAIAVEEREALGSDLASAAEAE